MPSFQLFMNMTHLLSIPFWRKFVFTIVQMCVICISFSWKAQLLTRSYLYSWSHKISALQKRQTLSQHFRLFKWFKHYSFLVRFGSLLGWNNQMWIFLLDLPHCHIWYSRNPWDQVSEDVSCKTHIQFDDYKLWLVHKDELEIWGNEC